jgi:dihydroxyacid dehydratase/phosphogluconate dehydratase
MTPCNAGIQSLVTRAIDALKAAGAMPQTWGFPTGSDGISMGTEGMRYSLPSREENAQAATDATANHGTAEVSAAHASTPMAGSAATTRTASVAMAALPNTAATTTAILCNINFFTAATFFLFQITQLVAARSASAESSDLR